LQEQIDNSGNAPAQQRNTPPAQKQPAQNQPVQQQPAQPAPQKK